MSSRGMMLAQAPCGFTRPGRTMVSLTSSHLSGIFQRKHQDIFSRPVDTIMKTLRHCHNMLLILSFNAVENVYSAVSIVIYGLYAIDIVVNATEVVLNPVDNV